MATDFDDRERGRTVVHIREVSSSDRDQVQRIEHQGLDERRSRRSLVRVVLVDLGRQLGALVLRPRPEDYSDRLAYLDSIYDRNLDREGGGL